MMSNTEIKEWLGTLPDDANIGVDERGLALQVEGSDAHLEVGPTQPARLQPAGGMPEEDAGEAASEVGGRFTLDEERLIQTLAREIGRDFLISNYDSAGEAVGYAFDLVYPGSPHETAAIEGPEGVSMQVEEMGDPAEPRHQELRVVLGRSGGQPDVTQSWLVYEIAPSNERDDPRGIILAMQRLLSRANDLLTSERAS